jgi:arginyl-tRNA synthetase
MKDEVQKVLAEALAAWGGARDLPPESVRVAVEAPPSNVSGDLASNLPLALGKRLGRAPRDVAADILRHVPADGPVSATSVAGPGFLNFTLSARWLTEELRSILRQGDHYARRPAASSEKILIEFVSANPNGPLHVGHGRGAALGDCLARLFRHLGYDVTTEYYINNIGNQMENLGASVMWRIDEIDPSYLSDAERAEYKAKKPEDLYKGAYLSDTARALMARHPDRAARPQGLSFFRREGLDLILGGIRNDLSIFGVSMDSWFPESRLYEENRVDAAFDRLRAGGYLKDEEGALWFRATEFGDDKDRVLKRQDERPTYFASDVAYHNAKFERGFSRLIDIWGKDHHGYVARVKAAVKALGHDLDRLSILLYELVSLMRAGKPVAMSTRSGEFVTLDEVVREVGKDASRFFFALRGPNSHLEFDLELAKKQASENPVFYVKYVHARCCSLIREAEKRGLPVASPADFKAPDAPAPAERALLVRLATFPDVLEQCRVDLSPHHLTAYLMALAGEFHRFYENCRVLGEANDETRFRLSLVQGVRTLIRNGLSLVGVDAPEEM